MISYRHNEIHGKSYLYSISTISNCKRLYQFDSMTARHKLYRTKVQVKLFSFVFVGTFEITFYVNHYTNLNTEDRKTVARLYVACLMIVRLDKKGL